MLRLIVHNYAPEKSCTFAAIMEIWEREKVKSRVEIYLDAPKSVLRLMLTEMYFESAIKVIKL